MHATLRRIQVQPGQALEVARLIEAEYLPQIEQVDGFVGYTLVDLGGDQIASVGLFANEASAEEANALAQAWTAANLAPYVASPLEARAGTVLVNHQP